MRILIEVIDNRVERDGEYVNEWSKTSYSLEIPSDFNIWETYLLKDFIEDYLEYIPRNYYNGSFDHTKLQYLKEIKDFHPYSSLLLSVEENLYDMKFPGPKKILRRRETETHTLSNSQSILDTVFSLDWDDEGRKSLFKRTPEYRYRNESLRWLGVLFEAIETYRNNPDEIFIGYNQDFLSVENRKRLPEIIIRYLGFKGELNLSLVKTCKIVHMDNDDHLLYLFGFILDPCDLVFKPMHEYFNVGIRFVENSESYVNRFTNYRS